MPGTGWTWALAVVVPALALVPAAGAQQHPTASLAGALPTGAEPPARSLGLPWAGALVRGKLLRESPRIRHLPAYARRRNFYGTGELVTLLERSAGAIARRWPGSRLSVGELSARRGGRIANHHSHRSGRDADIAFYMVDAQQRFAHFGSFLGFGRRAPLPGSRQDLRFDDQRNWELVRRWLTDSSVRVQYVFVSKPLRNRLLVEGRRRGADDELLRKAAAVLVEPKHGETHADHFHLRIYCPAAQRPHCKDTAPYWPWYDGTPSGGAFDEPPAIRWRPVDG